MTTSEKLISYLRLGALAVLPIVLLALPSSYFDDGESICLSKLLANMECYGCGMTRGIQHLIHFDFQEAYAYNKLSFVVLPLLIIMWTVMIRREVKKLI